MSIAGPSPAPRTIAIVGTGLIGTSIGLAVHRAMPGTRVVGFDPSAAVLDEAFSLGALDAAAPSAAQSVCAADLVILAPPVMAMRAVLAEIAPVLAPGTLVTDVGSTKQQVMAWAAEVLPAGVAFVGGHPMAGRVALGPSAADADLFHGAIWCITRDEATPPEAAERLAQFTACLGAVPRFLPPAEHDALVAQVSHLPYLLAVALVDHVTTQSTWPQAAAVAATGFAYASNLAGKDPRMYTDIMRSNRASVLDQLDGVLANLQALRARLADDDAGLEPYFRTIQQRQLGWLAARPTVQQAMQPPLSPAAAD